MVISSGFVTSSPSPDIVEISLIKPVGSFGTSVSILLAASSSRCFLLFLPTQKNFDGSGIGGRNLMPATGRSSFARSAGTPSSSTAVIVCAPVLHRKCRNGPLQCVRGGHNVDNAAAADNAEPRVVSPER